jgi:hypothetical protein
MRLEGTDVKMVLEWENRVNQRVLVHEDDILSVAMGLGMGKV